MDVLLVGQLLFPLLLVASLDLLVAVPSPGCDATYMKGITGEVRLFLVSRCSSTHTLCASCSLTNSALLNSLK